jgi:hypothetical protein
LRTQTNVYRYELGALSASSGVEELIDDLEPVVDRGGAQCACAVEVRQLRATLPPR